MSFTCNDKSIQGTICDVIKEQLTEINDLSDAYNTKSIRNLATINNASEAIKVDEKLASMIDMAIQFETITDGYYSPFNKNLVDVYKTSYKDGRTPTDEEIESLLTQKASSSVTISEDNLVKITGDSDLDISAVSRGYALSKLATLFKNNKINNYIASIGSTCLTMTHTKNGGTFDVTIPDTVKGDYLKLKDCSVGICSKFEYSQVTTGTASYLKNINPKTGREDYVFDKLVVIGDNPMLCSVMSMAGMFYDSATLEEVCSSKNLEMVGYLNQEVVFNTSTAKIQHHLK